MGFDLSAVRKDTKAFLEAEFPDYPFYTSGVAEDEAMPRDEDQEVLPFFIIQNGPLIPRPRGKNVAGARHDEYYSWTQLICISSVEDDAGDALAMVVDRLIGYKTDKHTAFVPDGAMTDYGSRQYSIRPVMYYQSQRFEYNLKSTADPLYP